MLSVVHITFLISKNSLMGQSNIGVESPHAVQKMLSLAQNTRMKQGGIANTGAVSPLPSPMLATKGVRLRSAPGASAIRRAPSLSQHRPGGIIASEIQPVDLNAESSSVTSLYAPRASLTSNFPTSSNTFSWKNTFTRVSRHMMVQSLFALFMLKFV